MWRRLLLLVMVAALLAAACGDDNSGNEGWGVSTTAGQVGSTTMALETTTTAATTTTVGGDAQAIADQIAAEILAAGEGDTQMPIDQESAQCIGNGVVGALGAPRIQELSAAAGGDLATGLEGLTESEVGAVLPVVLGCVDMNGLIVDAMTQSGISAQGATCVANAITQGTFIQDIVGLFMASSGSTELDPAVIEQVMGQVTPMLTGCLTPEELELLGFTGSGG